ncbi:MAG: ABC transporter permease [Spirochaetales bacterium]|nr:ABC transporter permease [Spirochaetales bacterium]
MFKRRSSFKIQNYILETVLVALIIIFAFSAPGFFTLRNVLNVLRNVSMQGIIAFAMTLVIISGEIDLSVGSAVAFAGCLTAFLTDKLANGALAMNLEAAIFISIAAAIIVGFGIGTFTGFFRTKFKVPTFITTLALMTALSGAANLLTNGFPITPFPEWYNFFGGGYVLGIPFPAIIFLVSFGIIYFLSNFTTFGRSVYAIGGNEEAARLSGIKVKKVKILVMGLVGALAALSGILISSQIMSGTPTTAKGWELDIISAVIIGGVSLQGGAGRIWSTFIGVVFLGIIINGMTLLNVSEYWQYVVKGLLILAAVLLNQLQDMKKRKA